VLIVNALSSITDVITFQFERIPWQIPGQRSLFFDGCGRCPRSLAAHRTNRQYCGKSTLSRSSWLLPPQRKSEDVIVMSQRCVTPDAFTGETGIFAIGKQAGTTPSSPSPALGRSVLFSVSDHKLDLKE
jgi:hypothetical protein